MRATMRFDRIELAGAFGDLGTLLPIVVSMILVNHLSSSTVFLCFGLFYLFTGFFYRLPIPVQPLKAVGALALAYPEGITEAVIGASGIIFGLLLLILALTGLLDRLARLFTQPVVRGIQLALGLVFLRKGVELIIAPGVFLTALQPAVEWPWLNPALGALIFILTLLLLDNKKFPAALLAVGIGVAAGALLGGLRGQALVFGPTPVRVLVPGAGDFWMAFVLLILPQIPLTVGNACVGTADACQVLFPDTRNSQKVRAGKFALTMGIANLPLGFLGAVPMCHGTGGLAAHYRFGARTGGAPVMIGVLFILLSLVLGEIGFAALAMIPKGVLGVLLVFAGLELCPLIRSLQSNEEYFVALLISGIAMAVPNMAWAFGIGIVVDTFIRVLKIKI